MLSDPNKALLYCPVKELTKEYNLPEGDRVFWIKGTKIGIRLCCNNDKYTVMLIANFGKLARGVARYSNEFYGPYEFEDDALRKCIEIVKMLS